MPSPEEVEALKDAMWQLLDDMGVTGLSVCLHAKAKARVAYEPFRDAEHDPYIISLEEAQSIVKGCEG